MTGATAETDGGKRSRSVAMLHIMTIQAIADEVQRPLEEIAAVYQCELVHMAAYAAVTDYLPVLVAKRVRRLYRHRLDALQQDDPCRHLIPAT